MSGERRTTSFTHDFTMLGGTKSVHVLETQVVASGVDSYAGRLAAAQASVSDFKKAVGLAGGAVAAFSGIVGGVAVNEARKFQDSMVELQKVTSEQTMRAMNDEILRMAETIPLSQQELADLTAQAGRFGIRGTENLRQFTETAARMAFATDLTADKAGENFARLATITNMPVSEVENLGATINELSNNFATSSSEIVDSALRSAGTLRQLGITRQEIYGLSAAINQASESSERAGTRMRRLAQNILSPSGRAWEGLLDGLNMTRKQFKEIRKQDPIGLMKTMAQTLAQGGKDAEELRQGLSSVSEQALSALGSKWGEVERAIGQANAEWKEANSLREEYQDQMGTLTSQLQVFQNIWRGILITIGQGALPVLTNLVKRVNGLSRSFAEYNRATNGVAAQNALLIGLFGGLATAIATVSAPLGAAVAAIGAFAIAWKNNLWGVRDQTKRVTSVIAEEFSSTVAVFRDVFAPQIRFVNQLMNRFASNADSTMTRVVKAIADGMIAGVRALGTFTRALLRLPQILARARTVFMEEWRHWWQYAIEPVDRASRMIASAFRLLLGTLAALVKGDMKLVRTRWKASLTQMRIAAGTSLLAIAETFDALLASVNNTVARMANLPTRAHWIFSGIGDAAAHGMRAVSLSLLGASEAADYQLNEMRQALARTARYTGDVFAPAFRALPAPIRNALSRVNTVVQTFRKNLAAEWVYAENSVRRARIAIVTQVSRLGSVLRSVITGDIKQARATWDATWLEMRSMVADVSNAIGNSIFAIGFAINNTVAELTTLPPAAHSVFLALTAAAANTALGVGASLRGLTKTSKSRFAMMRRHIDRTAKVIKNVFGRAVYQMPEPVRNALYFITRAFVAHKKTITTLATAIGSAIVTQYVNRLKTLANIVERIAIRMTTAWRNHKTGVITQLGRVETAILNNKKTIATLVAGIVSLGLSYRRLKGPITFALGLVGRFRNSVSRALKIVTMFGGGAKRVGGFVRLLGRAVKFGFTQLTRFIGLLTGGVKMLVRFGSKIALMSGYVTTFVRKLGGLKLILTNVFGKGGIVRMAVLSAGSLIGQVTGLTGAFTTLATYLGGGIGLSAIGTAATALALGPLAVLAGAVAALALAWTVDFAGARTVATNQMRILRKDLNTSGKQVKTFRSTLVTTWNSIRKKTVSTFNTIRRVTTAVFTFVFKNLIFPIIRRAVKVFGRNFGAIVSEVTQSLNVINRAGRSTMNKLERFWRKWGDEITVFFEFLFDGLVGIFEVSLDALITAFLIFNDLFQGDWESAWNRAAGFFERTFNGMIQFIKKWGDRFLKFINRRMVRPVLNTLRGWKNDAKRVINTAFGDITRSAVRWKNNFTRPIRNATNWVKNKFQWLKKVTVGNSIVPDMLSDLVRKATNWKSNFKNPFRRGLEWLENKFDNIDILSKINDTLSDVTRAAVRWKGNFLRPINKARNRIESAFAKMKNKIVGNSIVPEMLDETVTVTEDWRPEFVGRFDTALTDVAETFDGVDPSIAEQVLPESVSEMRTPAHRRGRDTAAGDEYRITINADSYEGGRAAARGFDDELRSRNFN